MFAPAAQPVRHLNLHEYQSKELMAKFGVNTQKFRVADTPAAAEAGARELSTWTGGRPRLELAVRLMHTCWAAAAAAWRSLPTDVKEIVVKAQIHAGGRGKGTFSSGLKGGVHLTKEFVARPRGCVRRKRPTRSPTIRRRVLCPPPPGVPTGCTEPSAAPRR